MKIAVTGARGFLGRYLVAEFSQAGHQVRGWSRNPHSVTRTSCATSKTDSPVEWITGGLDQPDSVPALVEGADVVVHAALHRVGTGFMDTDDAPIDFYATNTVGTARLIQAACDAGVKRFINVSSGAVHERVLTERVLDEDHPLRPASLYGAAKAATETLVHAYGFSGKLNACTIRPTSIYGVADPIESSKWYDLVEQIVAGKDVEATGGSKTVHAADVAKACRLLAETSNDVAGQTYNCTDRLISRHQVGMIAKEICQSDATIHGKPKEPGNVMATQKLQALGMEFGGTDLLKRTIHEMVALIQNLGSDRS